MVNVPGVGSEEVGRAHVTVHADASSVPGDIERGIDDSRPGVHDSGRDVGQELADGMDEGFQDSDFMKNFGSRLSAMMDDFVDGDFKRKADELTASLTIGDGEHTVSDEIDEIGDSSRRNHHWLSRFDGLLQTTASHTDDFADILGAATGRGSRNNFLNFIGSLVRNLTKLVALPMKGFSAAFDAFTKGWESGSGGFNSFGKGIQALLPLLGSLAASLIGAAVAIGFLLAVIGPLTAALSLLAGIVTALIASIGFALVAAFAALAAVALPAIAAIAIALGGILSMSDEMKKKFSDAFQPIKDEFLDLGQISAKIFTGALTNQADRFADILKGLAPLVRGVSHAIVDVGNSWLNMMEGPGFGDFIEAMTKFLPDAVRKLGDIFGHTIGGFGGILRGMIPFMRDVLRYLDGITERFSDWANSAEGQTSIERFFRRAEASLKAVWGFLGDVWDLLSTILDAGKNTGDSIFERMGRTIQGWVDALKENPDILKDWFHDAEDFALAIGHALEGIGSFFDELDNPDTRHNVTIIMDTLGTIAEIMATIVEFADWAGVFTPVTELPDLLVEKWHQFLDVLDSIAEKIDEISNSIPGIPDLPGFGGLGLHIGSGDEEPFKGSGGAWFTDMVPQVSDEAWTKILNYPENADVKKHFEDVAKWAGMVFEGKAIDFFDIIDWGVSPEKVTKEMQPLVNAIMKPLKNLFFDIMDVFGIPHPDKITDKVRAIDVPGRIENAIGNNTVDLEKAFNIPDPAAIARHFARQAQEIMNAIGFNSIPLERAFDIPTPQSIADQFVSLASQILSAVGIIDLGGLFRMPATVQAPVVVDQNGTPVDTPHGGRVIPGFAETSAAVGPSWTASGGKTINASGWTIVSPTEDAEAVATEVVNQLAAVGY